jgi:hypothetical protein
MATPLENLQAAYASNAAKMAEALANPRANYTVDGVSMDFGAYYDRLMSTEEKLRAIPGVVAGLVFDVRVDPGAC